MIFNIPQGMKSFSKYLHEDIQEIRFPQQIFLFLGTFRNNSFLEGQVHHVTPTTSLHAENAFA